MTKNNKIFTIPNILSMFRIVLIPFIVWTFLAGRKVFSAILIVLSGATDIVDGYIARRFNMISPLGKALDPIADKLTQLALIICLCLTSRSMFFLLCIFVIKEVTMGIQGLIVIKKTGTTYSACWYGKLTTVVLYFTMIVHVIVKSIDPTLSRVFIIICEFCVLASLILYTIRNVKAIKSTSIMDEQQQECLTK